jgi:hypothetical protein
MKHVCEMGDNTVVEIAITQKATEPRKLGHTR